MTFDGDHLWRAIAIKVNKSGRGVFKHHKLGPHSRALRAIGQCDAQPRMFNRVAQRAVGIARRGVGVVGGHNFLGLRRTCENAQGHDGRPPHQICFSGICTRNPSIASVTLIWHVRRDLTASG